MSKHELIANPNGSVSVKHSASGQSMHSSIGPWTEANQLYVEQSLLQNRLRGAGPQLVLYDVGLGIAANSVAAAECALTLDRDGVPRRTLEIHSFENDLDGLRTALAHLKDFPFLKDWSSVLDSLLETGAWSGEGILWRLHAGDFIDRLADAPCPELIFYDFYAPQTCPELWGQSAFERLLKSCEPRIARGYPVDLYTYAAATAARSAMLLAGWHLGYGRSTEKKSDTTVASTELSSLERPLDARWLERVARSDRPEPYDWKGDRPGLFEALKRRPQF